MLLTCAYVINIKPNTPLEYGLGNFFFLLFPAPLVPVGRADFES